MEFTRVSTLDLPPPLEDMTALLKPSAALANLPVSLPKPRQTVSDSSLLKLGTKATTKPESFGGLRKGFFNAKNSPAKSAEKSDIVHLKANKQVKSSLVFDSVQEKMKKTLDSGDKAWLNESFMDKIQNNPKLAKAFLDPEFATAAESVAKHPQEALKRIQETRPDLVEALKEFASLLGNQLMNTPVPIDKTLPEHEQRLLKSVQENPEVQKAFDNPEIKKALASPCPDDLMRAFNHPDPDVRKKMKLLLDIGFFSVETWKK